MAEMLKRDKEYVLDSDKVQKKMKKAKSTRYKKKKGNQTQISNQKA